MVGVSFVICCSHCFLYLLKTYKNVWLDLTRFGISAFGKASKVPTVLILTRQEYRSLFQNEIYNFAYDLFIPSPPLKQQSRHKINHRLLAGNPIFLPVGFPLSTLEYHKVDHMGCGVINKSLFWAATDLMDLRISGVGSVRSPKVWQHVESQAL